jgi:hypothetical protein
MERTAVRRTVKAQRGRGLWFAVAELGATLAEWWTEGDLAGRLAAWWEIVTGKVPTE